MTRATYYPTGYAPPLDVVATEAATEGEVVIATEYTARRTDPPPDMRVPFVIDERPRPETAADRRRRMRR